MKLKTVIGIFVSFACLLCFSKVMADGSTDTKGQFGFFGDYPEITGKTIVSTKSIPDNSDISYDDEFTLNKLVVGEKYKAEGSALDKTKGDMTDFSGEVSFVATETTMTVRVPMKGTTHNVGGHTIVTFQKLTDMGDAPARKGQVVLVKDDVDDKDETLVVESRGGGALQLAVDTGGKAGLPLLVSIGVCGVVLISGITYIGLKKKRGR